MYRLQVEHRFVLKYSAVWLFFIPIVIATLPFGFAGEKEDKAAAIALITIIESGKTGQAAQAERLFESIPANSIVRPVAAYSLALLHIRDHQFSPAWTVLTTPSKNEGTVPDSIKFGRERLKLWLRLEAGSAEKAEEQFNRLVTMSHSAEAANGDQTASCSLIGGVIGMLKADRNAACISRATLEEARELLLTKVEAKNAKAKLEEQLAEASKWGEELAALVAKFESMGIEEADAQNRSTQADFESTKQEELQLRDDLKFAGGEKRVLEDLRKKLYQNKNRIQEELKKEEKNKPATPKHPGPAPRQPTRPSGRYKTDPKTQERTFVKPSYTEESMYEKDQKLYNAYPEKIFKYHRDFEEYTKKLQEWEARVASLKAQIKPLEMKIASTDKTLKDMQDEIKQGIGKDLRQTGDQLDPLERVAAISSVAYKHVASNDPKTKNLFRPSNFRILDYESECIRLRTSLR